MLILCQRDFQNYVLFTRFSFLRLKNKNKPPTTPPPRPLPLITKFTPVMGCLLLFGTVRVCV